MEGIAIIKYNKEAIGNLISQRKMAENTFFLQGHYGCLYVDFFYFSILDTNLKDGTASDQRHKNTY